MRDAFYVKSVLDNIITTEGSTTPEGRLIYNARIQNLSWAYNNGDLRTNSEMETKMQSIREELVACEFSGDRGVSYKMTNAKLKDLKEVI